MAPLAAIVFDALDPAALANFWAAALDGYAVRPYTATEIADLAARGLTPRTDPSVAVDGPGPTLFFQKSDTATTVRNRLHLDIRGPARDEEVARLVDLGASIRDVHDAFTVLLDPEGNQLCVLEP